MNMKIIRTVDLTDDQSSFTKKIEPLASDWFLKKFSSDSIQIAFEVTVALSYIRNSVTQPITSFRAQKLTTDQSDAATALRNSIYCNNKTIFCNRYEESQNVNPLIDETIEIKSTPSAAIISSYSIGSYLSGHGWTLTGSSLAGQPTTLYSIYPIDPAVYQAQDGDQVVLEVYIQDYSAKVLLTTYTWQITGIARANKPLYIISRAGYYADAGYVVPFAVSANDLNLAVYNGTSVDGQNPTSKVGPQAVLDFTGDMVNQSIAVANSNEFSKFVSDIQRDMILAAFGSITTISASAWKVGSQTMGSYSLVGLKDALVASIGTDNILDLATKGGVTSSFNTLITPYDERITELENSSGSNSSASDDKYLRG